MMSCWRTNYPIENAYISEFYPDTNFGGSPYLYVRNNAGDDYESLLKFEVHHFRPFEEDGLFDDRDHFEDDDDRFFCRRFVSRRVLRYTLRLWIYRNDIPSTIMLYAYEALDNWNENTVTWNTQPAAGAVPIGSVEVDSGQTGWIEIDLGNLSGKHGPISILLRSNTSNNGLLAFYSNNFTDSAFWPQLLASFSEDEAEKPIVAVSGPPIQISPDLIHVRRRRHDHDHCHDRHFDRDCDRHFDRDCDRKRDRDRHCRRRIRRRRKPCRRWNND